MISLLMLLLTGCGLEPISKGAGDGDDSGAGGSSLMVGDVRISPAEVDFGQVLLDSTGEITVELKNTGSDYAGLGSAFLEGSTAFDLVATETPVELGGDAVVLTVTFTPDAEQPYEGSLNLLLDGEADFTVLPITGTGTLEVTTGDDTGDTTGGGSGALSLSQSSADLGRVAIGSAQSTSITVTNTGDAEVLISDVQSTVAEFTGDIGEPVVLAPGDAEDLLVLFSPSAETVYSGTLTLVNDSGTDPTISVTGEGFEDCSICQPILQVTTGGSAATTMDQFKATATNNPDIQTLTLMNTGDLKLTVTGITITNDNNPPSKIICGTDGTYALGSVSFPIELEAFETASVPVRFGYSGSELFCGENALFDTSGNLMTIKSDSAAGSEVVITLGGVYSLF